MEAELVSAKKSIKECAEQKAIPPPNKRSVRKAQGESGPLVPKSESVQGLQGPVKKDLWANINGSPASLNLGHLQHGTIRQN